MKKCVFLGSYDKTDMILYIAKILNLMKKKVLVVDTTILKKTRYIVPTMMQVKQYITTFEEIDVAIGFDSLESIREYQKENMDEVPEYDFVLFDIDRAIAYQKFKITKEDRHYFVTSFDLFNLKRGVQILPYIAKDVKVTKVFFTSNMTPDEDEYLNYLSKDYRINWNKQNIIFFPFETSVLNTIYLNQRTGRIQLKGMDSVYIDMVLFIAEEISGEKSGKVRKTLKEMEG